MDTVIHEEQPWTQYRLQYTITVADNELRRLEMCILNTESEREEEMRIYGFIGFEQQTYTCNLSSDVDIQALWAVFEGYLHKKQAEYSTAER